MTPDAPDHPYLALDDESDPLPLEGEEVQNGLRGEAVIHDLLIGEGATCFKIRMRYMNMAPFVPSCRQGMCTRHTCSASASSDPPAFPAKASISAAITLAGGASTSQPSLTRTCQY